MAMQRLLETSAFGPDEIQSLSDAYESVLRTLGLTDRNDPVTEVVAKKIIDIGQTGERNAQRLAALAIEQLGVPVTIPPVAE